MKKSKVLTGLVTTLAFTTQTFAAAAPQPSKEKSQEEAANLTIMMTINSSIPVERAMENMLAKDDYKEIKAFLEKNKVELKDIKMSDVPMYAGKIYYGEKTAEFQKDFSLRIDGHFYRYDRKVSMAENYKRLFNAFMGHHETDKSAGLRRALLPEAAAQTEAAVKGAMTEGMSESGKIAHAAKVAAQEANLEAWAKGPAFARPTNAAKISMGEGAKATISRAGTAARGALSRFGARAVAAAAPFTTALVWAGGISLVALAARYGQDAWAQSWHGVLSCKAQDPDTGRVDYQFSTVGKSSLLWTSVDTRTISSDELADMLEGYETYEKCLLRSAGSHDACDQSVKDQKTLPQNCTNKWAEDFTANRLKGKEKNIEILRTGGKGDSGGANQ